VIIKPTAATRKSTTATEITTAGTITPPTSTTIVSIATAATATTIVTITAATATTIVTITAPTSITEITTTTLKTTVASTAKSPYHIQKEMILLPVLNVILRIFKNKKWNFFSSTLNLNKAQILFKLSVTSS